MDQQLGVIDALQSLFAPRPPCGGRQSIFETQDPSFAYMASSRFGSLLTTFTEEAGPWPPARSLRAAARMPVPSHPASTGAGGRRRPCLSCTPGCPAL